MACDPKYIGYNDLKITICDDTVVSNVNTLGIPPSDCGAYLQSLSITSGSTAASEAETLGCSGSVSLVDYNNYLFNRLVKEYRKAREANSNPFVKICIELWCFTGYKKFIGHVKEWHLSFSGGAPTINMEWAALTPSTKINGPIPDSVFFSPSQLVMYAQKKLPDTKLDFVFVTPEGKRVSVKDMNGDKSRLDDYIKFINSSLHFSSNLVRDPTGNILVDIYKVVCDNSVTTQGKPIVGLMSEVKDSPESEKELYYRVEVADPAEGTGERTTETDTLSSLVFVQNGNFKPYVTSSELENKIVIPLTSLSVDLDLKNVALSSSIVDGPNGTLIYKNGTVAGSTNAKSEVVKSTSNTSTSSDAIEISFTCANVACFVCNNKGSRVCLQTYDENGNPIDYLCRKNLVIRSANYRFDGPVITADVKCTAVFGTNDITQTSAPGISSKEALKETLATASTAVKNLLNNPDLLKQFLIDNNMSWSEFYDEITTPTRTADGKILL